MPQKPADKTKGLVFLPRGIQNSFFWQPKKKYSESQAYLHLYMHAAWEDNDSVVLNGTSHRIDRAENIVSARELGKLWHWSKDKVRKFLITLAEEHYIEIEKKAKFTAYKITNYGEPKKNANKTP